MINIRILDLVLLNLSSFLIGIAGGLLIFSKYKKKTCNHPMIMTSAGPPNLPLKITIQDC